MVGINDIKPSGPLWPTPATPTSTAKKKRKQGPQQQSQQQQPDDRNKGDDGTNHIDEYA